MDSISPPLSLGWPYDLSDQQNGLKQMLCQLWDRPWEGLVASTLRGRQSRALQQHRLVCGGRVAWRKRQALPANTEPRTQMWAQGFPRSPSSAFQYSHRSNPK